MSQKIVMWLGARDKGIINVYLGVKFLCGDPGKINRMRTQGSGKRLRLQRKLKRNS